MVQKLSQARLRMTTSLNLVEHPYTSCFHPEIGWRASDRWWAQPHAALPSGGGAGAGAAGRVALRPGPSRVLGAVILNPG